MLLLAAVILKTLFDVISYECQGSKSKQETLFFIYIYIYLFIIISILFIDYLNLSGNFSKRKEGKKDC